MKQTIVCGILQHTLNKNQKLASFNQTASRIPEEAGQASSKTDSSGHTCCFMAVGGAKPHTPAAPSPAHQP
jgi:hypothetical protein